MSGKVSKAQQAALDWNREILAEPNGDTLIAIEAGYQACAKAVMEWAEGHWKEFNETEGEWIGVDDLKRFLEEV